MTAAAKGAACCRALKSAPGLCRCTPVGRNINKVIPLYFTLKQFSCEFFFVFVLGALSCSRSTLTIDFSRAAAYLVKRNTSLMIIIADVRQSPAMCEVTEWRNSTTANDSAAVKRPVMILESEIMLGHAFVRN